MPCLSLLDWERLAQGGYRKLAARIEHAHEREDLIVQEESLSCVIT